MDSLAKTQRKLNSGWSRVQGGTPTLEAPPIESGDRQGVEVDSGASRINPLDEVSKSRHPGLEDERYECKQCSKYRKCILKTSAREIWPDESCPNFSSYLESIGQTRGGTLEDELKRADICGSTAIELTDGSVSLYKPIRCQKVWCPVCGGKGGVIHDLRIASALRRVPLKDRITRYMVFTVPEELRDMLLDRDMLNAYYRGINKLIKGVFPGEHETIRAMHYEGADNPGKWHPHMNVLSFIQGQGVISPETLASLKDRYARMLTGIMRLDHVPDVVVHYSFALRRGEILNKLKYTLRPMSEDEFRAMPAVVQEFIACKLKGFQHVRYGQALKGEKNKEMLSQYRSADEILQGACILSPFDNKTPLRVVGFVSAQRFWNLRKRYKPTLLPGDLVYFAEDDW